VGIGNVRIEIILDGCGQLIVCFVLSAITSLNEPPCCTFAIVHEELTKCRSSDQSFACGHFLNLEQSRLETSADVLRSLVDLLPSVLRHIILPKMKHCPYLFN
jgi:hypothetical protein